MRIFGIETSCDETAAAIVENGTKIIANVVSSSKKLHEKTGGIIPEVAAREQIKCIIPTVNEAMKNNKIDAIAVTIGPGLIGSLLVGVETAKTIAYITGKPIIPVNHIFAHLYANWLITDKLPQFPAVALVVSGGHTELFLMKNHNEFKWLGGTRDDAAGEAFDKTARLLGLDYPGGPAIAAAAEKFRIKNLELRIKNKIKLPRPMIGEDNLEFSFSGLKTAVLREANKLKNNKQFNHLTIQQLACEVQESITDVLVDKTLKAARQYKAKGIILGGGVAANKRLSDKFKFLIHNSHFLIPVFIPPPPLCTDNAAYIASYAYFHNQPTPWQNIQAKPDLEVEV
jgi:N6-L-threonylcarbamoyladenine synthase